MTLLDYPINIIGKDEMEISVYLTKKMSRRLLERRIKLKITQLEMSEFIDKPKSYVAKIERGFLSVPIDIIEKISKKLRISVDEIKKK